MFSYFAISSGGNLSIKIVLFFFGHLNLFFCAQHLFSEMNKSKKEVLNLHNYISHQTLNILSITVFYFTHKMIWKYLLYETWMKYITYCSDVARCIDSPFLIS